MKKSTNKKVLVGGPTHNTKRIVLTGGCFDILHYGHVEFLKKAKSFGDYLIVAIESDKRVTELKGKGRPIHTQKQRREILESLRYVDEVIILKDKMKDKDYFEFVNKIKPAIIAVTAGDPLLNKKEQQAKQISAKVIEIETFDSPSTTEIIKKLNLL